MNIVERHNKGKLRLDEFNRLIPAVNEIVMQMEEMEDAHLGFTPDGSIDQSQFDEIEDYIDWILGDFEHGERQVIRDMVNDRMCYEPRDYSFIPEGVRKEV